MPFESKSKCKSIGASLSAAHATRIDTDVMSVHVNAVATATKFTNGSTISCNAKKGEKKSHLNLLKSTRQLESTESIDLSALAGIPSMHARHTQQWTSLF